MQKKILSALIVAIALVVVLYGGVLLGFAIPPSKAVSPPTGSHSTGDGHDHSGQVGLQEASAASFDSMLVAIKKKMSPQSMGPIEDLERQLQAAGADKTLINEELGKKWLSYQYPVIAANYFLASGKFDNSVRKRIFAAHLLNESFHDVSDPALRSWMASRGIEGLNEVLAVDSANVDASVELANMYISGLQQPMQGVEQLLNVVRRDSTNLQVNMILGKMAIESNQLDKAISRGETILRQYPENWEARIFMAEAYNRQGQNAKAIALLEEAKKLNKHPEFGKDVDAYISSMK